MKREDELSVNEVLKLIQQAQRKILEASQIMSRVPGFADDWVSLCKLYEAIKYEWNQIDQHRAAVPLGDEQ